MKRPVALTSLQNKILAKLGEVQFATPKQLQDWCQVKTSTLYDANNVLLEEGLIDGYLHSRPAILHLTTVGGRLLDKPLPAGRRSASWSVMAHACHLSEVQTLMAASRPGFRILSRETLFKQGLFPAFGEHGAIDDEGKSWLVLLDDYLMTSDRITRSWTRRHTPNKKYWHDPAGRVWGEVVQRFLVASTDEANAARHRAWIQKHFAPQTRQNTHVVQLSPLWKL